MLVPFSPPGCFHHLLLHCMPCLSHGAAVPAADPLHVANSEERAGELRKHLANATMLETMETSAAVSACDEVASELSRTRLQLKQQEAISLHANMQFRGRGAGGPCQGDRGA